MLTSAHCAGRRFYRPLGAALLCAAALGVPCAAQDPVPTSQPESAPAEPSPYLKVFDFDERPRGNYEDTPMFWARLTGEGFPAYSRGRIDDAVGHTAPPSFLFALRGGNIGYEYTGEDLLVEPDSDYEIAAYARCEGLKHAAALMVCYLIDEAGNTLAGSERASALAGTSVDTNDPWQRLSINVPVAAAGARALRLQLWVLQRYVWDTQAESVTDPIVRQDVKARVWFDDVTIQRLPRVHLGFSNPGGLVQPGGRGALELSVYNATRRAAQVDLRLTDAEGALRADHSYDVAPQATDRFDLPLPALPPGLYEVRAALHAGDEQLVERAARFAVLPELPFEPPHDSDLGVDLGRWPGCEIDGAVELTRGLACGGIKVGVPLLGVPTTDADHASLRQVRDLVPALAKHHIQTIGVALAAGAGARPDSHLATWRMIASDPRWVDRARPVFAYFGSYIPIWQLGDERFELGSPTGWTPALVKDLRLELEHSIAAPELILPRSVLDAAPATNVLSDDAALRVPADDMAGLAELAAVQSYWLPPDVPARAVPWLLAFWPQAPELQDDEAGSPPPSPASRCWLRVDPPAADQPGPARLAEMARRLVLAKAVGPARLFVPAPFTMSTGGGDPAWEPTADYIPLRTLFQVLAGQHFVAPLSLVPDGSALLFGHGSHDTLILWTWRPDASAEMVEAYAGSSVTALDLNGAPVPLTHEGLRVRIPVAAAPLILRDVDGPLLLLQDSFQVAPQELQMHDRQVQPSLTLRNPYQEPLRGSIELLPPGDWVIAPNPIHLDLQGGQTLTQPLAFTLPPRQIATAHPLGVSVHLQSPVVADLRFDVELRVALKDIVVNSSAWWEGDELVVQQTLHNLSADTVSFDAFCDAPQRPRLQALFLAVPPGDFDVRTYRLPAARELAGKHLWLGIQEIEGRRALDQLVAVPR